MCIRDSLVTSVSCTTYKNILIANNSDELNSYVYPSIDIIPKANGEIYICNMSDATINQTGTLSSSNTNYQSQLASLVNTYACLLYTSQLAANVGLDPSYISKIQNGTLDVEKVTNEDLKKKIDEYKDCLLYTSRCV